MTLVKHSNMVEHLPPDRANQPFSICILPWRSRRGRSVANPHRTEPPDVCLPIDEPVPAISRCQIANVIGWAPADRLIVKHENLAPGRSFKTRGALYRLSCLSDEEVAQGVVTSSTGNHAIGIALAARTYRVPALIVVPENAPEIKVRQAQAYGAQVRRVGANLSEAEAKARQLASDQGLLFIEDGNDRALMVGAGTIALEILAAVPSVDVIVVPVGGGNLVGGIAQCAKAIKPDVKIVGVQSTMAPAVYQSWRAGYEVRLPCNTFAGGLATDHPGKLAFAAIHEFVDEILLVSDEELQRSMVRGTDREQIE